MRDCPSGLAAGVAIERQQQAALVRHEKTAIVRHEKAAIQRQHQAALLRASKARKIHELRHKAAKKKKGQSGAPQTIYVATTGKIRGAAGKTAAHPLGSLTLALKRAASGSTIVLAPGTYALDARLIGKSSLTIQGAAGGSSIIAPSSGNALLVQSSSNVTINNVVFHATGAGGAGSIVLGSSVNLNNVQTSNTYGYGLVASSLGGQGSSVNVAGSQFDGSQNADGFHLTAGASANITGSSFNNSGGSPGSDSNGIGLEGGSSATISGSTFSGNALDGLLATGNAQVTITGSSFTGSRMGSGLQLNDSASATISNSTFNGNGTAAGVTQASNGMVVSGSSRAAITGSQFNDNTNGGLVASDSSQINVQQSSFTGNVHSDGAIFFGQANVTLIGNTIASNGQVVGITTGLNGVEFFGGPGQANNYTGTAIVSNNTFQNNTANGIFAGSGGSLTISNNQFSGNVVGIFLYGGDAPIHATVVGNTIVTPMNSSSAYNGITIQGSGLTATIGGPGTSANTIENFADHAFIVVTAGTGPLAGLPQDSILANTYLRNGSSVPSSTAIFIA
ncbi:MAG: right-handed parallel beta-helix repeat-containing protein [Isosphaeraceae bacterium]